MKHKLRATGLGYEVEAEEGDIVWHVTEDGRRISQFIVKEEGLYYTYGDQRLGIRWDDDGHLTYGYVMFEKDKPVKEEDIV